MKNKDCEALSKEDLIALVYKQASELISLDNRIDELEEQLESKGITHSRNFTLDTLYYLLCDRYGVNHHTQKDKLVELVEEELSL